jgi:glycosyltransferase involved in cell wall biosynthesis
VQLTIAGSGAEAPEVRELVRAGSMSNVHMLGVVPHDQVAGLYRRSDCAVVALRDRPIFESAVPTKLLEGMAAGRAVVLSARGEAANLVREAEAGVVVAPEDPEALAAVFTSLGGDSERLSRFGEAGRRLVVERFTRDRVVDQWVRLLHEVSARAKPAATA